MIFYTIHYMNPYVYMDNRIAIVELLRDDNKVDEFYNRHKIYYNMHFDSSLPVYYHMTDDEVVEFVFKLSNGAMENYSIPRFQIPFRSLQTGDIITLYDDENISNSRSYMYKPLDHIKLKEPVMR